MAFTDFTLDMVLDKFALQPERARLFAQVSPIQPSDWLQESLRRGAGLAYTSEKSRSEFLIAPILIEARELLGEGYSIYSGQRLDTDPQNGLVGECDFIIAKTPYLFVLRAPIVAVVEAKKQDLEMGIGQCAAQLVSARQFNQKHGNPFGRLYGCVTTGEIWQFLRLEQQSLAIDSQRYTLEDLPEVLAIFKQILEQYL
jgi:hypothetical protein